MTAVDLRFCVRKLIGFLILGVFMTGAGVVFSTMQGIRGDDTAGRPAFADETPDGRALVGFAVGLELAADRRTLDVEGADQVRRFLGGEMIEVAAQALAVEGGHPQGLESAAFPQDLATRAENTLHAQGVKSLRDIADGRVGWGTAPSQPESPLKPAQVDLDARTVPR